MKIRYIKYWAFAAVLGMGTVSCEDFLNRPTEDNYNESNFYQNDEQCVQGVNYLYNSPWYDLEPYKQLYYNILIYRTPLYSFEDGKCVRSSEKSVYGRVSGMESHGLLLFGT